MPKYTKPSDINFVWASQALAGDIASPDSNGDIAGQGGTYNILDGWDQSKPPYEIENYSMNRLYQGLAYYNQLGFPEWDADTEYQAGKSYVQGSNNVVYKCIQTHVNKNPATSGNEAFWNVWEGNRQATQTVRGTTQYATDSQAQNGSSANVALTPANLDPGVKSVLNARSSAPVYGCRAWASYNGITQNLLSSGNISNINRISSGRYQVIFSVPMQDSNYAVTCGFAQSKSSPAGGTAADSMEPYDFQANGFKIETWNNSSDIDDIATIMFSVFR